MNDVVLSRDERRWVGVIHGSVGPWLLGRIGLGVGSSELVSEI